MFHFELNGVAVWRWKEVCGQLRKVFAILLSSILPVSFRLAESVRERVGSALAETNRRFVKTQKTETNADGDVVEAGNKTGGDRAFTKRRADAPYAR